MIATAFTVQGRVARLRYFVYLMSYCPLIMVLSLFAPLYVIGIPAVLANYVCATVRRCHDIGLNGWWALVLGLPGPNLVLLLIRGGATNRFGEPPLAVRGERLLALVLLLLSIAAGSLYYFYVFRPAFQAYETRNAIGGPPWEKRSGESPVIRISFTSPTAGTMTLDSGQQIPMTYRGRYRMLYLTITIDGHLYMEQVQHDPQSNRLELLDGDAVVGTYGR